VTKVAAKVIQRTGNPGSMKRQSCERVVILTLIEQKVKREAIVWATANHPNILPFYGFADDAEFAPFGALISPVSDLRFRESVGYLTLSLPVVYKG
jgi:hypothetical protein